MNKSSKPTKWVYASSLLILAQRVRPPRRVYTFSRVNVREHHRPFPFRRRRHTDDRRGLHSSKLRAISGGGFDISSYRDYGIGSSPATCTYRVRPKFRSLGLECRCSGDVRINWVQNESDNRTIRVPREKLGWKIYLRDNKGGGLIKFFILVETSYRMILQLMSKWQVYWTFLNFRC